MKNEFLILGGAVVLIYLLSLKKGASDATIKPSSYGLMSSACACKGGG